MIKINNIKFNILKCKKDIIIYIINNEFNIINQFTTIENLDNIIFYLPNGYYILYTAYGINYDINDVLKKYKILLKMKINKYSVQLISKKNNTYNTLFSTITSGNKDIQYNFPIKKIESFNILCVFDKFSYECFKYEANLIPLDKKEWKKQIIFYKPDIFLCESAWKSVGSLLNLSNIEFISLIQKINSYCKENSIPTVFWNKEDNINYNLFINIAQYFKYIFTTDERCIVNYIKDTKNYNVYCLEFATQPKIHNPENNNRIKDIFFAGSWVRRNNERINYCKYLFESIYYNSLYDFDIYDRNHNKHNSFPVKYKTERSVNYTDLCNLSKKYKIMLNVNQVSKSNTMFSRRVYEGMGAGCVIISSPSEGIKNKFKEVFISNSSEETDKQLINLLDKEYLNKLSHDSYTRVIKKENYKKRLEKIIDTVGILYNNTVDSLVSVISFIDNIQLETIKIFLNDIKKQTYKNINVTLLYNKYNITELANKYDNDTTKFIQYNNKKDLSNIINMMKDSFIALMNMNDYYSNEYIEESLYAYLYINSNTDMIGKKTYIDNNDKIYYPDNEHKYVNNLEKYTIIFNKNRYNMVLNTIENISYKAIRYSVEKYNYKKNNI